MTKSEGYICLGRKAGLLQIGEMNAKNAAESGKAVLLLVTNDVSEPTRERAFRMAERFSLPACTVPFGQDKLADMCGKSGCMAAFTDRGLAAAYAVALAKEDKSYASLPGQIPSKGKKSRLSD